MVVQKEKSNLAITLTIIINGVFNSILIKQNKKPASISSSPVFIARIINLSQIFVNNGNILLLRGIFEKSLKKLFLRETDEWKAMLFIFLTVL